MVAMGLVSDGFNNPYNAVMIVPVRPCPPQQEIATRSPRASTLYTLDANASKCCRDVGAVPSSNKYAIVGGDDNGVFFVLNTNNRSLGIKRESSTTLRSNFDLVERWTSPGNPKISPPPTESPSRCEVMHFSLLKVGLYVFGIEMLDEVGRVEVLVGEICWDVCELSIWVDIEIS